MIRKEDINYFKESDFTYEGQCGLLANLYMESACEPVCLQYTGRRALNLNSQDYVTQVDNGTYTEFVNDGFGFGLAQWTFPTRKQKLLDFAKSRGCSIGDFQTQILFLEQELQEDYPQVLELLQESRNLRETTAVVFFEFERPADQSEEAFELRYNMAYEYYIQACGEFKTQERMQNQSNDTVTKGSSLMKDSSLASQFIQSPNCSTRTSTISHIAIHCMAGNLSAVSCGNYFAQTTTKASSHYGIGSDGDICQYVLESKRAWCTGGSKTLNGFTGADIDQRSVTIEMANTSTASPYPVSDTAYEKLLDLVEDIARRNGLKEVTYQADGTGTLQAHRWYAAKACPGDYLMNLFPEIATKVTARLQGESSSTSTTTTSETSVTEEYMVRVTVDSLNIRSGSGLGYGICSTIIDRGVYTIVETKSGWGKLKSGAGWISLDCTQRV